MSEANIHQDVRQPLVMSFGKHKGKDVEYLELREPEYLYWCARNIDWFRDKLASEHPDIFRTLVDTQNAMDGAIDAWAFEGGRFVPNFASVHSEIRWARIKTARISQR